MQRSIGHYCFGLSFAVLAAMLGLQPAIASAAESDPDYTAVVKRESPEATFDANMLGIVHMELTAGTFPFRRTHTWWRATVSNYRNPMTYPVFLRTVGRADLAESYEHRLTVSNVLGWTGIAIALGGVGVAAWGLSQERKDLLVIGGGAFLAGGLLWSFGGSSPDPELSEDEAATLAERYNQGLRLRLRLESRARTHKQRAWTLAPAFGPGTIGLAGFRPF
jgi:hypothetical protein